MVILPVELQKLGSIQNISINVYTISSGLISCHAQSDENLNSTTGEEGREEAINANSCACVCFQRY